MRRRAYGGPGVNHVPASRLAQQRPGQAVVHWPLGPLARIKAFSEQVVKPLFQPCTLLDLAGISLLAGIGEEMLFRGVLQDVFSRSLGCRRGWQ